MAAKFYKCESCGSILHTMGCAKDFQQCSKVELKELQAGAVDAAQEKHVPVINVDGTHVTVMVGEVEHPMIEEHYIEWIAIETETGMQVKNLRPGGKPHAEFILTEHEKLIAAYEYCNLHGLWKKEV